ncbi:MAG TPA: hypothetical protein VFJ85_02850 [Acidimicrobiales bacterium]|nr:hypothetical protein [Acidimicrobiales bacterium]
MKIRYNGSAEEGMIIAPAGRPEVHAAPGEWVEVDDEAGANLLEQIHPDGSCDWETDGPRPKQVDDQAEQAERVDEEL